eukprot:RCo055235
MQRVGAGIGWCLRRSLVASVLSCPPHRRLHLGNTPPSVREPNNNKLSESSLNSDLQNFTMAKAALDQAEALVKETRAAYVSALEALDAARFRYNLLCGSKRQGSISACSNKVAAPSASAATPATGLPHTPGIRPSGIPWQTLGSPETVRVITLDGMLSEPCDVVFEPRRRMYAVADFGADRVALLDPRLNFLRSFSTDKNG